ncbi:MAG: hypothetical protein C4576_11050 [Desulfobacteraceae bacterium]|nr:MAG: hypothetical protein C4576_11050 [Desulfobacteraceae bacterium]
MKRRRIIKDKSRIPGISVGDEVNTSAGEKKKVCFNINGRWFFRMVDPKWRAPGRPLKARGQKPEVGGRGSGTKGSAAKAKGAKAKEGDRE